MIPVVAPILPPDMSAGAVGNAAVTGAEAETGMLSWLDGMQRRHGTNERRSS
jgi:hypothetical protein